MTSPHRAMVFAAALIAAAGTGIFAGQRGLVNLPFGSHHAENASAKQQPTGPVIYYRDPDGKPLYSLGPKNTDDGRAFVAVQASEDVSFDQSSASPKVAAAQANGERKLKYYRNPMGLPDTSPVPKKDSMGMDYIAVYDGEDSDDGSVKVSPGKLQRTGVETTIAGKLPITRTLKAPGVVALDERRISVIAPRFDGFIVSTGTATSGSHIKKGEVLVTAFGQDVLDQAARLLIEQAQGGRDEEAPGLTGGRFAPGGAVGATRRLRNLGVPEDFIDKVKRDRRVPDTVVMTAPFDGIVLERMVVDGQAFKPGDVAFRVADHSVVWVLADIPESDVGAVQPGQFVTVRTRAHPGRELKGEVALVYPHLMKETRTGRVRIELDNSDLALLPDMYADVDIETGSGQPVVVVPSSAVIDSGSRKVVIVAMGEGRYLPRNVKLGQTGDGFVEIIEGVADGDRVVVNGNFLIDAESNLQAALKALTAPDQNNGAKP